MTADLIAAKLREVDVALKQLWLGPRNDNLERCHRLARELATVCQESAAFALRTRPDYDFRCQRCGAPHNLDVAIPNEIWNQIVERDSPGGDKYEALCMLCIDDLMVEKRLTGEAKFFFAGRALKSARYEEKPMTDTKQPTRCPTCHQPTESRHYSNWCNSCMKHHPLPRCKEALPCPFCGSLPEMEKWHGGGPQKMMVSCGNGTCWISPEVTGRTKKEAIRRWNMRCEP